MKRAILYARVSTLDTGNRLETQLEMCREHAQTQGYQIIAEMAESESGASGVAINLPQLSRLREMAAAAEFEVLVVREMDRLSRSLAKQVYIESELRACGIEIDYVLESYDDSPEGQLGKHIKAAIAEFERTKTSERTIRQRRRKVAGGHVSVPVGKAPYGYKRVEADDGTWQLEIEPDEAQVVLTIFEMYTEPGAFRSQREIARYLTETKCPRWVDLRGIKHNARTKAGYAVWQPSTVGQMLRDPLYVGRWRFGKHNSKRAVGKANDPAHLIEVEVPAIVDQATYDAAQRRKARNKAESKGNTKYEALLRRRLICRCGVGMGVNARKRKRATERHHIYYQANHHDREIHPAATCSQNRSYRADILDAAAWGWVQRVYGNVELIEEIGQAYQEQLGQNRGYFDAEIKRLEAQIATEEHKVNALIDLAFTGHSATVLQKRQREIEQTIAELAQRRARLRGRLAEEVGAVNSHLFDFLYDLAAAISYPSHSFDTKRALIDTLQVRGVIEGDRLKIKSILDELVEPIVDWSTISPIQNVIVLPEYSEVTG